MDDKTTQLPPRADDAPRIIRENRIILKIGGRRYETVHRIESREITRGPAEIIEMPDNRKGSE